MKKIILFLLLLIVQFTNITTPIVYGEDLLKLEVSESSSAASSPSSSNSVELSDVRSPVLNLTQEEQKHIQEMPDYVTPQPSGKIDIAQQSALMRGKIMIHKLQRTNFRADETVNLHVENTKANLMQAYILDAKGKKVSLDIDKNDEGEITTIQVAPPVQFSPGKYTIVVKDNTGYTSSQDFTWGVLALNTSKSIYQPHQDAHLSMAVLDDNGNMVCDASLTLLITDKNSGTTDTLSTQNGKIKVNKECYIKDFVTKPDYEAFYQVGNEGDYLMSLTAVTKKGKFNISDRLYVREKVAFDVERNTATRIYPPKTYPVTFTITANEDFQGKIAESVPSSFVITPGSNGRSYDFLEVVDSEQNSKSDVLGIATSSLTMPIKGVYELSLGFGKQLLDPLLKNIYTKFGLAGHDGIDLAVPIGTSVIAVDDGEVVFAGEGDYGITVVLAHQWGKSYYGHLSDVKVKIGEKVTRGKVIALSGDTGISTGPHLHFSVKPFNNNPKNGYYGKINPLPYLGLSESTAVLAAVSENTVKLLTWDINIKKGDKLTLSYNFKAPNISPQFYQLGKLRFINKDSTVVFAEERQWQIAADVVEVNLEQQINILDQEYSTTAVTPGPTDNSLGLFEFDGTKYNSESTFLEAVVKFNSTHPEVADDVGANVTSIACPATDDCKIVYYNSTNFDLRFADCDDATCSTSTRRILDGNTGCVLTGCSTTISAGSYSAIACPTATDCKITYYTATGGDLYFADCDDATCSTGTRTLLDGSTGCVLTGCSTGSQVGYYPTPVCLTATDCKISYYNVSGTDLYFADCDDATCSTGTTTLLDGNTGCVLTGCSTTDIAGFYNVMTCPTATDCKISYFNSTGSDLYFADCDDATCSTGTTTLLDGNTGCVLTGCGTAVSVGFYPGISCPAADDCKISYYNSTAGDLYFVDCGTATCSSGTTTLLDGNSSCTLTGCSTTQNAGSYTSLICPTATDCKISYANTTSSDLHFADCDDATCSTGTRRTLDGSSTSCALTGCQTVAATGNYTSLACPSATDCKISYYNTSDGDLYFADCSDATCSSGTAQRVDGGGNSATEVGTYTSVSCPSATDCKIAYHDASQGDLLFIDCNDTTCTNRTITRLDGGSGCELTNCKITARTGLYSSIVCLTADDCKISYYDATSFNIRFADCDDATCSTGTSTLLDGGAGCSLTGCTTVSNIGAYTSLACPTATDCKVTYYSSGTGDLLFGDCDNATCSTGTRRTVDGGACLLTGCSSARTAGSYTSLSCPTATDCKISYHSATGLDLYFADCDDATCSSGAVSLIDGGVGCTLTGCSTSISAGAGAGSSIDCPTATDCKISYYDATGADLYFADCDNATCSTGTTTFIDGGSGCVLTGCFNFSSTSTGFYSALACPTATDCKISYYNSTNGDLYFADCADTTCSTGTATKIDGGTGCTLTGCDVDVISGQYLSISCLTATDCKIIYTQATDGDLYLADCNDGACTTGSTSAADEGNPWVTVSLYDSSGNAVANGGFSYQSSTYERVRMPVTLIDGTYYTIRVHGSESTYVTAYVKAARLIVVQTGISTLTDTQTQIEIGANTSTSSTTVTSLTNPKYYQYDSTKFDGTVTTYFEASAKYTGGAAATPIPGSSGPLSATASGDCVNDTGTGTAAWTSPGNAFSDNATYATVSVDGTTSNYIKCTNYGFNIPAGATIVGIVVGVERKSSGTGNGGSNDAAVRIVKGGVIGATDKSTATSYTTSDVLENHGSSSDTWGETWTVANINASTFGAAFAATKPSSAGAAHTVSVDRIIITVHYTESGGVDDSGTITLYNRTDGTTVSGSTLTLAYSDTSWALWRTASPITLTTGKEYEVRLQSNDAAATAVLHIANAKLIINQTNAGGITKLEIPYQMINAVSTDTDSIYTSQNALNTFNPDNLTGGDMTYSFESTMKTSAGTGYAQLYNVTDSSAISGSEISTSSTSYTRVKSSSITMPTAEKSIDTQLKNSASNTTSASNTWLLVEITNLGIDTGGETPTNEQLLRHGKWFNSSGVLQPFTF